MTKFDLDTESKDRIREAEHRYTEMQIRNELAALREALEANNALMMGLIMRGTDK